MKFIAFTTTNWHSPEDADRLGNPLDQFGLVQWLERIDYYFNPVHVFLACGTWSDPALCPIPVPVVNSGVPYDKPYNPRWWAYAGCAQTAAHCYALNRNGWDLAVQLDPDIVIGAVDFAEITGQFCLRDDLILSPSWFGKIGGPFIMWKREAMWRWLHQRHRANLIDEVADAPEPPLLEEEMTTIFEGRWFNPWPDNDNQRYECGVTDAEAMHWPFVRRPSATMLDEFNRTQTSRSKPVLA